MKDCKECHHRPSCRFDMNGWECHCECHNVADAAPDMLAALKIIARGDYDNAHDCKAAAKIAQAAIRSLEE